MTQREEIPKTNVEIKVGGLIKNELQPSNPLSKELFKDMKSIGINYVITSYTQDRKGSDNLNSLLETLSNADEVGIDVITSFRVLSKTESDKDVIRNREKEYWWYADNFSEDKLKMAIEHPSFKGVFFDEPNDKDETFENLKNLYDIFKKYNVKVDINLFPNYTSMFTADNNKWNTGRNFKEYVERYAQISDTIGVDFYPINYSTDYYIAGSKLKAWAECLETLLQLHHKYPEKDYKIFIQTSKHTSYGVLTDTSYLIQTYGNLIGGCCDVRYFCLADNDAKAGVAAFECSPYTSDHTGYQHGETYNIVKLINQSTDFKTFRDNIGKRYIDHVDIYKEYAPILGTITNFTEFVRTSTGNIMVSVGYDKENAYCHILNIDPNREAVVTDFYGTTETLLPGMRMTVTKKIGGNESEETQKKPNIFKRIWNWIKNIFK